MGCATSWSLLMWSLFKAVPVPGSNISLPLYESTESCETPLPVEWQPDLSWHQNIFSLDYGMQVERYFMSILLLQSSWWGRQSWLLCLFCLPGVSWWLSGSSSQCQGVVCGLWMWYFLIILTIFDTMSCWKLNRHGVFLRLGWYLLCYALVTKVFDSKILTIDIHHWGSI